MNDKEIYENYGCVFVENFIDSYTIKIISKYLENKIRRGEWKELTEDPTSKYFYYADPLIETILDEKHKYVENIIDKKLHPTYSYARIYQPGESLKPHIDRSSCEISVTVNVATVGEQSPIWMKYMDYSPKSFYLKAGDAVIYKGCESLHWREEFNSDQLNVQFMLHYVDCYGPHSNLKFDNRPNFGYRRL